MYFYNHLNAFTLMQLSYLLRTLLHSWVNEALSNVTDSQANLTFTKPDYLLISEQRGWGSKTAERSYPLK